MARKIPSPYWQAFISSPALLTQYRDKLTTILKSASVKQYISEETKDKGCDDKPMETGNWPGFGWVSMLRLEV